MSCMNHIFLDYLKNAPRRSVRAPKAFVTQKGACSDLDIYIVCCRERIILWLDRELAELLSEHAYTLSIQGGWGVELCNASSNKVWSIWIMDSYGALWGLSYVTQSINLESTPTTWVDTWYNQPCPQQSLLIRFVMTHLTNPTHGDWATEV